MKLSSLISGDLQSPYGRVHAKPDVEVNHLRTSHYEEWDLARMLQHNAEKTHIWDTLSPAESTRLQEGLPNCQDPSEVKKCLEFYLHVFDKAYFFGAVEKKLRKPKLDTRFNGKINGEYQQFLRTIRIVLQLRGIELNEKNAAKYEKAKKEGKIFAQR